MEKSELKMVYGLVRTTDNMNRITIPREFIKTLDWKTGQKVSVIPVICPSLGHGIFISNKEFGEDVVSSSNTLDDLNRLTIPKLYRAYMGLESVKEDVEIFTIELDGLGFGIFIRRWKGLR